MVDFSLFHEEIHNFVVKLAQKSQGDLKSNILKEISPKNKR